jgi:acyl-CoA dehydrogenase
MFSSFPLFGICEACSLPLLVVVPIVCAGALAYTGAPLLVWLFVAAVLAWVAAAPVVVWMALIAVVVLFAIRPIRRAVVSAPLLWVIKKLQLLPPISTTEQEALDAGTTWIDKDIFSGAPNIDALMGEAYPKLTAEERAFLEGPCDELCRMVDDWKIHREGDMPPEIWEFLKKHRFFGLNIPKKFGGHEFSALAYSTIVMKVAARSTPVAVTVMVPNSLGPAELLHLYGTAEQQERYLHRLATGDEIPCFGLTEPEAASDAGSITSEGVLFKNDKGELSIRLNWKKRYITLGSVATLLGLAIKLRDPENILGKGVELGITTVLVPANLPGVRLGRRHDPLGCPFINCPIDGHDVIVPVDAIIGGIEQAGKGWKMLMGCLAAGRGLSLPAQAAGGGKNAARVVSAYAALRKQFGIPIGMLEGIEEPLARVGGLTYLLEAVRVFTCGGVDAGRKSSVVSAAVKAYTTEIVRKIGDDAMDIQGGGAISLGPRNLLAFKHIAAPIGVTVEGANILTRSLIIFGNGVFRCHPNIYGEMVAILNNDVKGFDTNFWAHIQHVIKISARVVVLCLTRGFAGNLFGGGPLACQRRRYLRASAAFALHTDLFLAVYTGALKRKEKLMGRMADVFSHLYMATAVMRRFEAEGRKAEQLPFARFALDYCFYKIQYAFEDLARNIDSPILKPLFRLVVLPNLRFNTSWTMPNDMVGQKIARTMQGQPAVRNMLTEDIFVPKDKSEQAGVLEHAYLLLQKSKVVQKKLREAVLTKKLKKAREEMLVEQALAAGVITSEEAAVAREFSEILKEVIKVDEFNAAQFKERVLVSN